MKKIVCLTASIWVVVTLLSITSCHSTNLYDEEEYEKYLDYNSPVDSIDSRHEWLLTKMQYYTITANKGENIEAVMILADNPLNSKTAVVLNQAQISEGESVALPVNHPLTQKSLYAALVDKGGKYYVTRFPCIQTTVDFSNSSIGTPSGLTLKPQTYSYIFEENFPLAGDYDYNDLVLQIGVEKDPEIPQQVTLDVTLAAVGCTNQLAGLIRLLNCSYSDIESVITADGKTFNDNLPAGSNELMGNTDLFIKGQSNEAVINLFSDAHWAMDPTQELTENSGSLVTRKYYNTSWNDSEQSERRACRNQKYIITFNTVEKALEFTVQNLDPFIVTIYNGARYETHRDELAAAQVLYKYNVEYRIKNLPWTFVVPMEKFRYPLEGVQIGFRKKTQTGAYAMFGAYVTRGHSFGEWVEDCQSNLDWYEYPTDENEVWKF